jgi:hypothetical protein
MDKGLEALNKVIENKLVKWEDGRCMDVEGERQEAKG